MFDKAWLICLFATAISALPKAELEERDLLSSVVSGLGADSTNAAAIISAFVGAIEGTIPTTTPSTYPEATSILSSAVGEATNIIDSAPALIANGFDPNDIESIVEGYSPADNSLDNDNPRTPSRTIYPKASAADAPYSVPESSLRASMLFPPSFTYGEKPAVILFPGTGVPGGPTWALTYGRILQNASVADPMWVNIPTASLDDAQVTAEYAAYAMDYVAGITNRNVSIIAFSQGSLTYISRTD